MMVRLVVGLALAPAFVVPLELAARYMSPELAFPFGIPWILLAVNVVLFLERWFKRREESWFTRRDRAPFSRAPYEEGARRAVRRRRAPSPEARPS